MARLARLTVTDYPHHVILRGNNRADIFVDVKDRERMLALLRLIDEYLGVSNTNMHLCAGLGRSADVLVSGSVVIEVVFNIPGMGSFLVDSIGQRDYNAVMAVLLASSILTQLGLLLSDLSYAFVDPRISLD